jgi:hypothetical protein
MVSLGVALLVGASLTLSCSSEDNNDTVGAACKVIVEQCGAVPSMGDCIDLVGGLDSDCLDCVSTSTKCDYSACQASIPGCRLPNEVVAK